MNFLAHLYLSGDNSDIKIGNFIGDFVKSSDMDQFSAEVNQGIQLHWAIDDFTDHHPTVKKSKERLTDKYGHYAAVIIDIFYDHFLAINWKDYHPASLREFVNQQYRLLERRKKILPKRAAEMLPFMIQHDWLYNYQFFQGIQRVMFGMSRRAKFDSKMDESVEELKKHHNEFEKEFRSFFPELCEHCDAILKEA